MSAPKLTLETDDERELYRMVIAALLPTVPTLEARELAMSEVRAYQERCAPPARLGCTIPEAKRRRRAAGETVESIGWDEADVRAVTANGTSAEDVELHRLEDADAIDASNLREGWYYWTGRELAWTRPDDAASASMGHFSPDDPEEKRLYLAIARLGYSPEMAWSQVVAYRTLREADDGGPTERRRVYGSARQTFAEGLVADARAATSRTDVRPVDKDPARVIDELWDRLAGRRAGARRIGFDDGRPCVGCKDSCTACDRPTNPAHDAGANDGSFGPDERRHWEIGERALREENAGLQKKLDERGREILDLRAALSVARECRDKADSERAKAIDTLGSLTRAVEGVSEGLIDQDRDDRMARLDAHIALRAALDSEGDDR